MANRRPNRKRAESRTPYYVLGGRETPHSPTAQTMRDGQTQPMKSHRDSDSQHTPVFFGLQQPSQLCPPPPHERAALSFVLWTCLGFSHRSLVLGSRSLLLLVPPLLFFPGKITSTLIFKVNVLVVHYVLKVADVVKLHVDL